MDFVKNSGLEQILPNWVGKGVPSFEVLGFGFQSVASHVDNGQTVASALSCVSSALACIGGDHTPSKTRQWIYFL